MKSKKLFVSFLVLLLFCCFGAGFGSAFAEEEAAPDLMDAESWSETVAEVDGEIKLDVNAYSSAPIELAEDYLKIEFSLDSMGTGHSDTWASFCIISKPVAVSPAGKVDSNGLYFLFCDFDGQLTVSLLHKSPLGETYMGIEDPIYGANPAIGPHTLEVFVLNEVVNVYIDGMQYKRALLDGIYKEDFCSVVDNNSYLAYASFGANVSATLLGYSTENLRDLESPQIEPQLASDAFVGEEYLLSYPIVTDNQDSSFAVRLEIFDPTGLKISPKNDRFTPSMAGEYKINYFVMDASGNEDSVSFTLNVTEKSGGCNSAIASYSMVSLVLILGAALCAVFKVKSKR